MLNKVSFIRLFFRKAFLRRNNKTFNPVTSISLVILLLGAGMMQLFNSGNYSAIAEEINDEKELADWTFLVYLAADNDLEYAGVDDFNQMEMVGSTDEVNIIVLFDRADQKSAGAGYDYSNGDWKDTRAFRVKRNHDKINFADYEEGVDMWLWGERNTGDTRTLIDFVDWAVNKFPAKNYMLDMWNHGGGYRGVCWDYSANNYSAQGIHMDELGEALSILRDNGIMMDIIGFDACLMGGVEVLYEIAPYADYSVTSPHVEPMGGWDYKSLMNELIMRPKMSPKELGEIVARTYYNYYTNEHGLSEEEDTRISMAVYELSIMSDVYKNLEKFSRALASSELGMQELHYFARVAYHRSLTGSYYDNYPGPRDSSNAYPLRDIVGFAERISKDRRLNSDLRKYASDLASSLRRMVVYSISDVINEQFNNHVSIYFPTGVTSEYNYRYEYTSIAEDSFWKHFLLSYQIKNRYENTPPALFLKTYKTEKEMTIDIEVFDIESNNVELSYSNNKKEWHPLESPVLNTQSETVYIKGFDGELETIFMINNYMINYKYLENEENVLSDDEAQSNIIFYIILIMFLIIFIAGYLANRKGYFKMFSSVKSLTEAQKKVESKAIIKEAKKETKTPSSGAGKKTSEKSNNSNIRKISKKTTEKKDGMKNNKNYSSSKSKITN